MNSELEKQKKKLNEAINSSDIDIDKIKKISKNIDNCIIQNYIKKQKISEFEKKYKNYTDRKDKKEILRQIKSDILDNDSHISIIELEILSNDLYDFCCLMINNIPTDEIKRYISYKNKNYYDLSTDTYIEKFFSSNKIETSITMLIDKYINILKNNK